MAEEGLHGQRILVVEDEYLLADDVREALTDAGAEVLGPVATVKQAAALIAENHDIDAAVLDVNLQGEMIFPVADALRSRGIPFAFTTGYDHSSLPDRFADAIRLEKPLKGKKIAALLAPLLASSGEN